MRLSKKCNKAAIFSTTLLKIKEAFTYFLIYHFFLFSSGAYAVGTQNLREEETKNPSSIALKKSSSKIDALNNKEEDTPSIISSSAPPKEAQGSFSGRFWGFYTTAKGIVFQNVSSLSEWLFNTNQKSFMATAQDLPFFGEDISSLGIWHEGKDVSEDTNSSVQKKQTKGSFKIEQSSSEAYNLTSTSFLTSLGQGLMKGIKFTTQHPLQAMVMVLSAQVAASAAFKTSSGDLDSRHGLSKRALGDEFQINQNTASDQRYPFVSNINGTAFVLWDEIQTGYSLIHGRIFSSNGTALTDSFNINQNTYNYQQASSATNANNNAFVVWQGYPNGGGTYEIFGRLFSSGGTPLTNDFWPINQVTGGHQHSPSIKTLTNSSVFVSWMGDQTGNNDIYGRIYSIDGSGPLSNEFTLNQNTAGQQIYTAEYQIYSNMLNLDNSNLFVAWQGNQAGRYDIYGRIMGANGALLTNDIKINQNSLGNNQNPSLASASGNVFIVWSGDLTGNSDIYGRLFSPDGNPISNETQLNQISFLNQQNPAVTTLDNGNLLVVWQSNQIGNSDIYGRLFSPNGFALTNDFLINQDLTADQIIPSIANINNNAFVTWIGGQTGDTNIYGRVLTPSFISTLGISTTREITTNEFTTNERTTSFSMTNGVTTEFVPTNSFFPSQSSQNGESSKVGIGVGVSLGSAVLLTMGGIAGWKYYKNKRQNRSEFIDKESHNDVELNQRGSSPFAATPGGFTNHPTVVGALQNRTYEIWRDMSSEERSLVQPNIGKKIPSYASKFVLGKGNFGATYVGAVAGTKDLYAIKEVYGRKAVDESQQEGELQNELQGCPYIMTLVDYRAFEPQSLTEQPRLFQVMPLAYTNGAGYKQMLSSLKEKVLHENLVHDSFQQVMKGLAYMHDKGIYHLDMKDGNILYMQDGTLRIADFGRARKLGKNDTITDDRLGDRRYFSPEQFAFVRHMLTQQNEEGEKVEIIDSFPAWSSDTWGGGLYTLELLAPDNPLSDDVTPYHTKLKQWTYGTFQNELSTIHLLQEGFSTSFKEILRNVLAVNFKERLKPAQTVQKLSSLKALSSEERTQAFKQLIVLQETSEKEHLNEVFFSSLYTSKSKEEDRNYIYRSEENKIVYQ